MKPQGRWLAASAVAVLLAGCATTSLEQLKEAEAHHKVGLAHINENELRQAVVELRMAVGLNPDERDFQYALGYALFRHGRFEEAIPVFQRAITLDPKFAEARNHLGKTYEVLKQHEEAIAQYLEALKNPMYRTPHLSYYNLGQVYLETGRLDEAKAALQDAVRSEPRFALAYYSLGEVYARLGLKKDAIQTYEEALRLAPTFVPMHLKARLDLGLAYLDGGRREEAREAWSRLIELAPTSEQARKAQRLLELAP